MKKIPIGKRIVQAVGLILLIMTPSISTVGADDLQQTPILQIQKVTGGYKSITATLINLGEANAKNVTWGIIVNDVTVRFLREINVSNYGMIDMLYAHDGTVDIHIDIPKGFGTVKVSLIAEVIGINRYEARIYAFILGTRVIILP